MFRLRHLPIDTLREHVIMIHEQTVRSGALGFNPLDRVRVWGIDSARRVSSEIVGVLNFCRGSLLEPDEIGLSDEAFHDLGLPENAEVNASLAVAPASVDLVRAKPGGGRLERADFEAILADVAARRYSRVELAMFVFACSLKKLGLAELVDYKSAHLCRRRGIGRSLPSRCRSDRFTHRGVPDRSTGARGTWDWTAA
jgi:thymidine phosphorylase